MNIPEMKERKRIEWKIKRDIEGALRFRTNHRAKGAIRALIIDKRRVYGLHPDTQQAACNLVDCGMHTDSSGRLVNRFGIVEMVMNDYYTPPTMENIIEYGLYCGCRIRYDQHLDAVIQQHEIIFEGDHWILYYSPHGYWVMDCLPF